MRGHKTYVNIDICFDMDGTLADLYGVPDWLEKLEAENTSPYKEAAPMFKLSGLARRLNNLQRRGATLTVISWTAKNGSGDYNKRVAETKEKWLKSHLPSVKWDNIIIIPYGTDKGSMVENEIAILFDDDRKVREEWETSWRRKAYSPDEINIVLGQL